MKTTATRVREATLEGVGGDPVLGGMTSPDAMSVLWHGWGLLTADQKVAAIGRATAERRDEAERAVAGPGGAADPQRVVALDPDELDAVDVPSAAEDEDQSRRTPGTPRNGLPRTDGAGVASGGGRRSVKGGR